MLSSKCSFLFASVSLAALISGCAGGRANPAMTIPASTAQVRASRHIVVVMEENTSYRSVVGNTVAWPNLNRLISHGALPTHYYANTHPSIGNYFDLTTGQILTNNDSSTKVWNVDNIARRMIQAGVSFRVYAEGVPRGYIGDDTGLYVVRHNPFAKLQDVAGSPQTADKYLWPFSQFAADASANALPRFSFIVPDIMDDAHSGSPQQADAWLQTRVVEPLASTTAFKTGGDGLLIVDFDESVSSDTAYGGGHVAPVFWGPLARAGYRQASTTVYQHPSLLSTIMAALGLPNPPGHAAGAPVMGEFFAP